MPQKIDYSSKFTRDEYRKKIQEKDLKKLGEKEKKFVVTMYHLEEAEAGLL